MHTITNCYLVGATAGRPDLALYAEAGGHSVAARLVFRKSFKKVLLSSGVYTILKYLSAYSSHHLLGCGLSYTNPLLMLVFTGGLGQRQQTIDVLSSPVLADSAELLVSRAHQVLETFTCYLSASILPLFGLLFSGSYFSICFYWHL